MRIDCKMKNQLEIPKCPSCDFCMKYDRTEKLRFSDIKYYSCNKEKCSIGGRGHLLISVEDRSGMR